MYKPDEIRNEWRYLEEETGIFEYDGPGTESSSNRVDKEGVQSAQTMLKWTSKPHSDFMALSENELITKAQQGCKKSQLQLVDQYERLVHKLARKYGFTAFSFTHDDLAQEGRIGLINAIKTFDSSRGAGFMTWAYYQIRGSITSCGRSDRRQPAYPRSIEDCQRAYNISDPTQDAIVKEDLPEGLVKMLLEDCCGGLNTKRAKVVIDRFGLFGQKELRNCETAEKYGITKYAVNTHVYSFKRKAAQKFPYLKIYV